MHLRKLLIKLSRKLEQTWGQVNFRDRPVVLKKGWYITEFKVDGILDHIPELLIKNSHNEQIRRSIIGAHSGRNRMLVYLPDGHLLAYDKSIQFNYLARISYLEGRARVLLISLRYLFDLFSFQALIKVISMQFMNNYALSYAVYSLRFYDPKNYLVRINQLEKKLNFWSWAKHFFAYRYRNIKIAVVIENEQQKNELEKQLIKPDYIIHIKNKDNDSDNNKLPDDIDYFIALQKTEELHPVAIYLLKQFIYASKHKMDLIYTDHDYIGKAGIVAAFKPNPSLPYIYCFDYIGPAVVWSASALKTRVGNLAVKDLTKLLSDSERYHFIVGTFSKNPKSVARIDETLFRLHRNTNMATPKPQSEKTNWLSIKCIRGDGYNRLLAEDKKIKTPSVDLIIPTKDGLRVLKPCIESILSKTDYPNFTITIVDNGSELAETKQFFDSLQSNPRVKILSYPGEFNFSAINNFAVQQSKASYVGLINNDIEVIKGDWLTHMMAWIQQQAVGIVGAKLLFGNGDIQHAGVTLGMGNAAGHIHRFENGNTLGYQHRCVATQKMMAVTAACLITSRALYQQIGGLDEVSFKVAYNDIDFCLKIEKLGYDIIWTPEACLYHHESVSRGDDMSDQHIDRYFKELTRFQKRWKAKKTVDKYYSKYLRVNDEGVYPLYSDAGSEQLEFLD